MNPSNLLINARAAIQIAAALPPWLPTRGLTKSSEVTATWLTKTIGSAAGNAVALSATELDGTSGTTDRRRLVVEWDARGKAADLPANLFIKSSPLAAKNRVMVAALDMAVNEVKFYRHAAQQLEGMVPRTWYAHAGDGARFCIVLDDIVAHGAKPYAVADHCDIAHARGLIDTFAQLHAQFWESPRFTKDLSWARRWSARPGNAFLKYFYQRGRQAALDLDRPEATPAVRAVAATLDTHIDAYYREFEQGPLTLLHGDSHLGNTFSLPDGRAGLLDWQVVWQGPGLREVAYWMTGGLEPEVRRKHEHELLDRYLEGLRAGGVTDVLSAAAAFERYRLFAAEAWDAAAMTIAWPGLQAPENTNAGWRRTCIAVEDLDTAGLMKCLYA